MKSGALYTDAGCCWPSEMAEFLHYTLVEVPMLALVFLLLVLWFLGFVTTYTLGGLLHILLVVAIVLLLIHVIQGSSIGNA